MRKGKKATIIIEMVVALFFMFAPIVASFINPSSDNYINVMRLITCLFGIYLLHNLACRDLLEDIEERLNDIVKKIEGRK
jgi:low affinity Fe/Cu permease